MLTTLRKAEYAELIVLFFIQAAAMAIWFVPLGPILEAHGMGKIRPFAFASSAVAAFISPLMFGAMADRHVPPARVLRWLATATAVSMTIVSTAIKFELNQWLVLGLIQFLNLSYAPMFSISSALVLARLRDAQKEFGPIRGMATIGWMAGALVVSLLNADTSARAGYAGAIVWLAVAGFTYFLPQLKVPRSVENLTWRERFGLDALTLLKNRDHRVVFITATLFNIPLAAFYPYAPAHLRALGFTHTSAWMSLAQVSEIVAMFSLGWMLLNWRLKWIFVAGLSIGVLRFALSALNLKYALLLGISLHGASFTFVFITAAIYLDQRIDPRWRTRAQALLALMSGGIGSLTGYLGTGFWFEACAGFKMQWTFFWGALAAGVLLVLIYFLTVYRGQPLKRPALQPV
ncbi:MAG TPA: MFS transporter [Verrucomicrobiae bacterium]|nr:MFS transporter [Verrucomicrobiae bacterium]